jgi:DNA-binding HxlR family transcriptional regulator
MDPTPTEETLELLARRWVFRIASTLRAGPMRYMELRRSEAIGASERVLTDTLHLMQQRQLIDHVPPNANRGVWELSPLGQSLLAALEPVERWAQAHHGELADTHRRVRGDRSW